ncbi:hypothetical protein LTR36_003359 [Oleoguttula mirabilis]|uniref:PWWP domain-containing protein n=1 Tax=Oleoguttula mirabilis TaxID=1507867 RepID=A0AAV9JXY7_9PEZI|nr:hypothetical protein LTR36_003359 [Oleoguttula mirabilis]
MADDATTTAPVAAQAVSRGITSGHASSPLTVAQPAAVTEPTETLPADGEMNETTVTKEDEEIAGKQATTEVTAPDGDTTEVVDGTGASDSTPASGKKEKRKSTGGIPEHKMKKLNKKKSMLKLQLDCKPGEFYWARLKGYPPWPSIICDEQMLPESLLASRPVSTARPDGSLRADFQEGGKNAKERTFPIMFLSTNEFSWMINTALTPLKPEECNTMPKTKMTKALQNAYKLAAEDKDLAYYKSLLAQWQEEEKRFAEEYAELEAEEARLAEERVKAAEEAGKEEEEEATKKEKKKKAPRKSKVADDDIEMEDAELPKSSKKRKKEVDSDAEGKPKKTPKVTKINAPKTPNGEAAAPAKKSTSKPKKKVVAPKAEEDEEEAKPQMTEAEKLQVREKAVLYLRHRLQKGFLSRDQAPQESEMAGMADFFTQLEGYENLEPAIIRVTKIHKVLKAIVKLSSIPKDEELQFKKRSGAMLETWNKRMEADGDAAPAAAEEPKSAAPEEPTSAAPEEKAPETNGDANAEPAVEAEEEVEAKEGAEIETEEKAVEAADSIEEKAVENTDEDTTTQAVEEPLAAPVEEPELGSDAKEDAVDGEGDVSMQTAPEEIIVEAA